MTQEQSNESTGIVDVVGQTWFPYNQIRKVFELSSKDVESIRLVESQWFETGNLEVTDRAVERWIKGKNTGEFHLIHSFSYTIREISVSKKEFDLLTNLENYAII